MHGLVDQVKHLFGFWVFKGYGSGLSQHLGFRTSSIRQRGCLLQNMKFEECVSQLLQNGLRIWGYEDSEQA